LNPVGEPVPNISAVDSSDISNNIVEILDDEILVDSTLNDTPDKENSPIKLVKHNATSSSVISSPSTAKTSCFWLFVSGAGNCSTYLLDS